MKRSDVLFALPPGLVDRRNGRTLLVWGELGRWLVVDDELHALLGLCNGRRPLKQVLRQHARLTKRPESVVVQEAMPVLETLAGQGILRTDDRPVRLALEPVKIANLTLNITNRCNLRCHFCYNDGRRTEDAPVDALMAASGADPDLFGAGASFILLGGEPLLDLPRTLAALDHAAGLFRARALLSTNGTLLTPAMAGELARRNVEVQVSLDAPQGPRHDAGRGAGSFARAVAGVQMLVAAGVPTILSMVYTARNLDDFEPYLAMAAGLGVQEARFIPLRQIGGGLACQEAAPDQVAAFQHLLDVLARRPEFRPLLGRDYFSIIMAMCRMTLPRSGCGIGRQVILVDADGTVYPCPNHVGPDLAAGNVLTESLAAIVHDSPVMKAMRSRYRVDRYRECRECPFRSWCAGDCRGETLSVTGDPQAPSPHCPELKRVFLDALWLLADGDPRFGQQNMAATRSC
jgi:radical SAM protein with 4Fe4S-binding SPASM domain